MKSLIPLFALLVVSWSAHADLRAPERQLQAIVDPANVITDRGSKLEILPTVRAVPQIDSTGHATLRRISSASASYPISPQQLGVVYNHSMQQQGYISGEIAFKMKAGATGKGLSAALYPGLKQITKPEVYVTNARTPAEFMKIMKRLQARADVEWVVPTVTYGPTAAQQSTR